MAASTTATAFRHPVVALSHGPGPLWLLNHGGAMGQDKHSPSAQALRSLLKKIYPKNAPLPKRILYVSAHYEAETSKGFAVSNMAAPDMIYDYYGFPRESYDVVYGAKGDSDFAEHVQSLLAAQNIPIKLEERGFDHGTFVPMMLIRAAADIPIVTMSINSNLSDAEHFALGKALAPLRDQDTLIISSGQATHNLRAPRDPLPKPVDWALDFQQWLDETLGEASTQSYAERKTQISSWRSVAPAARLAHPTADHFLTFVVGAGAGMEESKPEGKKVLDGWGLGHMSFATYAWGVQQ